jgi:hypothetical protein
MMTRSAVAVNPELMGKTGKNPPACAEMLVAARPADATEVPKSTIAVPNAYDWA